MIWVARVLPYGNLHSVALKIREMIKAINQINESVKRPQAGSRTMQQLPTAAAETSRCEGCACQLRRCPRTST
jgi:negative regulator of sigma E activity